MIYNTKYQSIPEASDGARCLHAKGGTRSWNIFLSKKLMVGGFLASVFIIVCWAQALNTSTRISSNTKAMVRTNYPPVASVKYDTMDIDDYADIASEMMNDFSSNSPFEKILPVLTAAFDKQATDTLNYLNHTEAYALIMSASGRSHYFSLVSGFDSQLNQFYCGPAAVQATLNSLRPFLGEKLPLDPLYLPFKYATQYDIFQSDCAKKNVLSLDDRGTLNDVGIDPIMTAPFGLTLDQGGQILRCVLGHQWNVKVMHVDPRKVSLAKLRENIVDALENETSRVLIAYSRSGLGQKGGGHFSPIAAYHEASDSFLIMDVAKYKHPPVWATSALLYNAVATVDGCGTWDWPRGQLRLSENLKVPRTRQEWAEARKILNCQPQFRGLIIVSDLGK